MIEGRGIDFENANYSTANIEYLAKSVNETNETLRNFRQEVVRLATKNQEKSHKAIQANKEQTAELQRQGVKLDGKIDAIVATLARVDRIPTAIVSDPRVDEILEFRGKGRAIFCYSRKRSRSSAGDLEGSTIRIMWSLFSDPSV